MKKVYLLYVRKYNIFVNDYTLCVYKCETEDIFNTMGEMIYRTFEHIKRIDFAEWTKEREDYVCKDGYKIYDWQDKYLEKKNKE